MQKGCSCKSSTLYAQEDQTQFRLGKEKFPQTRKLQKLKEVSPKIVKEIQEGSELWLPNKINKISMDEIMLNPLWFYKEYLGKNIPVIIMNTLDGDDICERWSQQKYLEEVLEGQQLSISLTPDGFADSIKGEYFVEPQEVKKGIKTFFNTQENYPSSIAYIQHQNNNLAEQLPSMQMQIPQQSLLMLSESLFDRKMPDAQNLWLGRKDSVSAIHKDPYENFYTTIVGEKHFTLVPPTGILRMEEFTYNNARWHYSQNGFQVVPDPDKGQTKWIACNPDLPSDYNVFPQLKELQKYHVVLEAGQMLYLPSLWYHQVSQEHPKDDYALAINYWFDMNFSQNYSLYQLCRSLKQL